MQSRVRSHGRHERLEPCVGKLTRTVLRGGECSNALPLTRPYALITLAAQYRGVGRTYTYGYVYASGNGFSIA